MPEPRREAIRIMRVAYGTRAIGGLRTGSINFAVPSMYTDGKFGGTPAVSVTKMAGSSGFARTVPLTVSPIQSNYFTWSGSPTAGGTFMWSAFRKEYQ